MVILRTLQVFFKLLPSILALKKDRKKWIAQEKKDIDQEQFRGHARRILNTCVSLGPVYIKFGQWLSSRADILPQPYLEELSKLQDNVPAESFEKVKPVIERDIGKIDEKFESLDVNALSGASLGQVYRATKNGQQVIVKVKRPGIEKIVEKDLKVLMKIIPFAMRFVDPNLKFSIIPIMKQFVESMHEELDYSKESDNLKTIKKNMMPYDNVVIPNIHDDYSTKDILTMEYIPGIKITDVKSLDEKGIDRQKLVIDVHKVFFTMLLRHSIFHADPHPGNISVRDDGTLILYDFGMIGRLNDETRLRLVRLYLALVEKNPPRTVNAMEELGMLAPDFNRQVIEKGIEMSIKSMYGQKPDEMEVEMLMQMANKTMSKFPFQLPKHLALYLRMSTIIEGIYHTHKVDFKFIKVLRTILEEESLIKDAYIEEIKKSFSRFAKSVEDTITKEFWEHVSINISEWQLLIQKKITSSEIRKEFVHGNTNSLNALGIVGRVIMKQFPKDWKTKIRGLKDVNWSRDNPQWEGRLLLNGRMLKNVIGIELAANTILQQCGIQLSDERLKYEKKA